MNDTCLFTGTSLTNDPSIEHTIPKKFAGKIQSNATTCGMFNNACGAFPQNILVHCYKPLLHALSPLLSSDAQPSKLLLIRTESGNQYVLDRGLISQYKSNVVRGEDGEVQLIQGPPDAVEKVMAQLGIEGDVKEVSEIEDDLQITQEIRCEADLSLVISTLTTFDHYLRHSKHNFCRDSSLLRIREQIAESVTEKRVCLRLLRDSCLGIQSSDELVRIRRELPIQFSRYEHVLFVSGGSLGFVDAVFWAFSLEPFGFRLTSRYKGPPFGYAVVNPVLKSNTASELFHFEPQQQLCIPRPTRCWSKKEPNPTVFEPLIRERMKATVEAALFVETNADDWVFKRILHLVERDSVSFDEAIRKRLLGLYHLVEETELPIFVDSLTFEPDLEDKNWVFDQGRIVNADREKLTEIVSRFGTPKKSTDLASSSAKAEILYS